MPTVVHCGEIFACTLLDMEEGETPSEAEEGIPDNLVGVITRCDGPPGHTDHHVAGFMNGQRLVVWPVFPDADGNIPFRIQTREGAL